MVAMAAVFSGETQAEWATFSRPAFEIGVDWAQRDLLLQDKYTDDDELRFGVDIRQRGYWSDPRIVAFNYYFRPSYSTRELTTSGTRKSELLNYAIAIDILRGAMLPVEGTLRSSLKNSDYKATLAGDNTSRSQQHTVELRWKFAPFPMQFTATEQDYYRKSTSVFSEAAIERDDQYRKFRIRGNSSKLSLQMEHETRESRFQGLESDFQYDTARLAHKFSWGKNSLLRTRYDYRRRIRDQEYVSNVFTQDISVQHTYNLVSELNYRIDTTTGVFDTQRLEARYALRHQLYRNLSTSVFLHNRKRTSDSEDFTDRGAGLGFDYGKDFFGTRVRLGADLRRSNIDRKAEEGFVEIFDEVYNIPPDGRLVLSNRLIVQDSVIITNATGSIVYVEGFDYELLDFGDALLIVNVIPGGDLATGQSVLISYTATLDPSGEYQESLRSFDLSLSRGGWYFSHYALRNNNDLIEGSLPNNLVDRRESHSSLDYNWDTRFGGFKLGAKRDLWEDSDFELSSLTLNLSATLPISQSARATLTFSHQETETVDRARATGMMPAGDQLDTVLDNIRLDVDWRVTGSLTIRPSVIAWKRNYEYRDNRLNSFAEDVINAEIELDYRFRRFSANLRVFYNDWEIRRGTPGTDSLRTDDGFRLSVRRAF